MNENFFDIEKEKQDRIINSALKAFALQGYKHASTEEIAKDANVSKGLVFHYFGSKVGLYRFVYDFSVKYMTYFLQQTVNSKETDFFMLHKECMLAELSAAKKYEYMLLFLETCRYEDVKEALVATEGLMDLLDAAYGEIMALVDRSKFKDDIDPDKMIKTVQLFFKEKRREEIANHSFQAREFYLEASEYLDMYKRIASK
ncbi:MAG: TetR/AcrR family transcriptional regulator [Lachnospiraceae bacterium]|nr:TetR/AcrR family transcriptional regulator [Lachnospiraceae bacterium]